MGAVQLVSLYLLCERDHRQGLRQGRLWRRPVRCLLRWGAGKCWGCSPDATGWDGAGGFAGSTILDRGGGAPVRRLMYQ